MIIAILLMAWIKRNKVVSVLLGVTIVVAFGIIGLSAAIGAMAAATGITQQTTDTSLPTTIGVGLAVLAAALSGVVSWLGHRRFDSNSTDLPDSRENRVRLLGRLFLLAALCFTMFAVLWPIVPEMKDKTDWWSTAIRWSTLIFLTLGSAILSLSALFGIFETIYRLLQEAVSVYRASKRLSKK